MAEAFAAATVVSSFAGIAAVGNTTTFELDGWIYDVGPMPTWKLLDALADGDIYAVVPGACPAGQRDELIAALEDRTSGITPRLLSKISAAVMTDLSGCPWWSAMALASTLKSHLWTLDARIRMASGSDLLGLPVRRLLPLVYNLLIEGAEESRRIEIDNHIWERPADADAVDNPAALMAAAQRSKRKPHHASPEQQWASFQAFAAFGGKYGAAG